MRFYELIFEGYSEAQTEFAAASGNATVAKNIIDQYKTLVTKNQVKGDERNIDWWRKQGWEKFNQFVSQKIQEPTKTQIKRSKVVGQSITLMENNQWLIVIPLDKDASCFHGKNSDWCTTKRSQSHFEEYFYIDGVTLVYCLNKINGGMWALAIHKGADEIEIFTQNDKPIDEDEFYEQTRLSVSKIVDLASSQGHVSQVSDARAGFKQSIEKARTLIDNMAWGQKSPAIEKELLTNKDSDLCLKYIVKSTTKGRMPADFPEPIVVAAARNHENILEYVKTPSESLKVLVVKEQPNTLQHIKYPSEKVQLAAVSVNPEMIDFIENPSVQVQLAAVNTGPYALAYIDDPSEEVQHAALRKDGSVIRYIKNPSERAQLLAVSTAPFAIEFINNPSTAVQIAAVQNSGMALKYIDNPSEEVQIKSVMYFPQSISYIEDPSEKVQLAAVKSYALVIDSIDDPTEAVQMAAVQINANAIRSIKNPTEQVQLAAIKENPGLIKLINNPTDRVRAAAEEASANWRSRYSR